MSRIKGDERMAKGISSLGKLRGKKTTKTEEEEE